MDGTASLAGDTRWMRMALTLAARSFLEELRTFFGAGPGVGDGDG